MRTLAIDDRLEVAADISRALASISVADLRRHTLPLDLSGVDTVVYRPPSVTPDIVDVRRALIDFMACAKKPVDRFVLLSSSAVYTPSAHHEGLVSETRPISRSDRNRIAASWQNVEAEATRVFADSNTRLIVLRSPIVPLRDEDDSLNRLFSGRVALTLPGHDPSIQLLSRQDLAEAVRCIIEKKGEGIYHVAPRGAMPLRKALRLARTHRLPVPRRLQSTVLHILESVGSSSRYEQLEYIRYPWTIAARRLQDELGFSSKHSSLDALQEAFGRASSSAVPQTEFDDFGMDPDYIRAYGRTLLRFLERYYWRIELSGAENIPRQGRGVLVGVHRGFMPWDGVMTLHLILKAAGRIPRFLVHPTLVKFPFLTNFMTKLGGIIACQDNANYVLERDGLLGVYPEGIHGAFTLYRNAYKLGRFGRHDFVKMALRNRAPIIPFVTVGSAETFPILRKIEWRWWQRYSEWPFFPITPTFPLLPIPLPSKWHTQFLPAMHVERQYPAEAADDPAIVNSISVAVRTSIQNATDEMLRRRKFVLFGSVFHRPSNSPNVDTAS